MKRRLSYLLAAMALVGLIALPAHAAHDPANATPSHRAAAQPYAANSQPPALTRTAGPASSASVAYVGSLQGDGAISSVAISGTFAYIGEGGALTTIDVGDPDRPQRRGRLPLGANVNHVQVVGARAYVALGAEGLRIVDLTNPVSPTLLGGYDTPGEAMRLTVVGDRAYIADGSSGLQIVDVRNPAVPTLLGGYDTPGSASDVQVADGLAYIADGLFNPMQIVDVSDPHAIRLRSSFGDGARVWVAGNLAYLTGYRFLQIIDVSNPSNPQLRSGYCCPKDTWATAVQVVAGRMFLSDVEGLEIVDVQNPDHPARLGVYEASRSAADVQVSGNLAYIASGAALFQVVDVGTPAAPALRGSYGTPGRLNAVQVAGALAYTVDKSGLKIVDISDPTAPAMRGSFPLEGYGGFSLDVVGNLAYVTYDYYYCIACHGGGLKIIDVSDPDHPTLRGSYTTAWGAFDVHIAGNLAYLAAGPDGLQIVDVSDPGHPTLYANFVTAGYATRVQLVGDTAYVGTDNSLVMLDVAVPSNPLLLGSIEIAGAIADLQVIDTIAYVTAGQQLQILDVSNPASPALLGSYDAPGAARGIHVASGLVYLAHDQSGLLIVDTGDPRHPFLRGSYDTPGCAADVDVVGDLIYLADGPCPFGEDAPGRLFILRLLPLATASASIDVSGGSLTSPADATSYIFASGTFSETAVVTHTVHVPGGMPATGQLVGGHPFDVMATSSATGLSLQPTKPYTITVHYTGAEKGQAIESTLALYFWDGQRWVVETSSTVDTATHTLTATPDHFSIWAVLGETRRVYLPLIEE